MAAGRRATATTPAPVSRISSAAAPSGGTTARIGRPTAMYSKTLPERTPFPRPPASGMSRRSASESRCSASDSERGAYGISSSRSPSSSPCGPLPVGLAEVAEEAGHDVEPRVGERLEERPRVAPPEEAPGVREAEPLGRRPLEPDDVVEVAAVRDRHDGPARAERPRLLGDRLRDARDRVGARGDELRNTLVRRRLGLRRHGVGAPVGVRDERVAEIGDPAWPVARAIAAAMRCVEGGGDVDTTTSIPCSRTSRIPAGMAVTAHVAFSSGRTRRRSCSRACVSARSIPSVPASTSLGFPPLTADVARPVHPGLRRHPEPLVAVHPARVVGREDVGLDPHRRQVLRELERPLHAAAARGRKVEADDQRLHGRDRSVPRADRAPSARRGRPRAARARGEGNGGGRRGATWLRIRAGWRGRP